MPEVVCSTSCAIGVVFGVVGLATCSKRTAIGSEDEVVSLTKRTLLVVAVAVVKFHALPSIM